MHSPKHEGGRLGVDYYSSSPQISPTNPLNAEKKCNSRQTLCGFIMTLLTFLIVNNHNINYMTIVVSCNFYPESYERTEFDERRLNSVPVTGVSCFIVIIIEHRQDNPHRLVVISWCDSGVINVCSRHESHIIV